MATEPARADGVIAKTVAVKKGPRPGQCRNFTKKQVAAAWPKIVESFVEQAAKGSYNHTKLLVDFSDLKNGIKKTRRGKKGKSLATILMAELERQKQSGKDDARGE